MLGLPVEDGGPGFHPQARRRHGRAGVPEPGRTARVVHGAELPGRATSRRPWTTLTARGVVFETYAGTPMATDEKRRVPQGRAADRVVQGPGRQHAVRDRAVTMSDMITTCLWFDTEGEEAAEFYCSRVPGLEGRRRHPVRRGAAPRPAGTVMTVDLRARRPPVRRPQRRPGVPVHRGRLVPGELRRPGGGRPLLGHALVEGGEESCAVGSRTATGSPGRSSRRSWRSCSPTRTRSGPGAPCRRC